MTQTPRPKLKLPPNVERFPGRGPCRVLALSGGGYRGLFSARVLERMTAHLPERRRSPREHFSLLAGTSVGGLVAAGFAVGRTPTEMVRILVRHGERIFDPRYRVWRWRIPLAKPDGHLGGLLRAKYERDALEAAIVEVLGDDAMTVGDVPMPLLLVATCATTKAPFLMSNVDPAGRSARLNPHVRLVDALLATSAAPGYFPAVHVERRSLIDGGLVANAPDLVALAEAIRHRQADLTSAEVLSVGTAGPDRAEIPADVGGRGLLRWMTDLVPLTLDAQESLVVSQAQALLGDRYRRINASPAPGQVGVLALDAATRKATDTLLRLADAAVAKLRPYEIRRWFPS